MPIAINGSGTITGVSVGGLPDGIVDTDMIANSNVTAGKLASGVGGKILQIQSTTSESATTTTSSSFTDVTGFSLAITPVILRIPFEIALACRPIDSFS